ncbi:hypothetical protein BDD12DRAFT_845022 [Trichophaea hybrida]|nr:hypothetical protein BDD12DRAFT_845022 [Trichophaea hybrida]
MSSSMNADFDLEMQNYPKDDGDGESSATPGGARSISISTSSLQKLSSFLKYDNCTSGDAEICHDLDPYYEYLDRAREKSLICHFASATKDDDMIRSFSDNLREEINSGLVENSKFSCKEVYEIVLHHIGLWLLMEDSFTKDGFRSRWMAYYCERNLAEEEENVLKGNIGLRKLLRGGGLLPSSRIRESPGIARKDLNAYKLTKLGRIKIEWSTDITEHLTLKHEHEKTSLLLFSLPCILGQHSTFSLSTVGISNELQYEITLSYGLLFGRFPNEHSRRWIPGKWMCNCIGCKVAGTLEEAMIVIENTGQVLDPSLRRHCREMKSVCNVWVPSDFKHFWTRIHDLNQFLQERKPRTLVQLFKDRRDTLQYYTFCFAVILLILTVVQVLLAIAQTTTGILQVTGT